MKVKDMIETLQLCDPESEVRIAIKHPSIGRTPSVGIKQRFCDGFDWDKGVVILYPEVDLVKEK